MVLQQLIEDYAATVQVEGQRRFDSSYSRSKFSTPARHPLGGSLRTSKVRPVPRRKERLAVCKLSHKCGACDVAPPYDTNLPFRLRYPPLCIATRFRIATGERSEEMRMRYAAMHETSSPTAAISSLSRM
jgi:hypothetical protein